MLKYISLAVAVCLVTTIDKVYADETTHSQYAGQQTREIKSLSKDDIIELRRGGGWGLARAAELNGIPGPAHLLELKAELNLLEEQVTEITRIFETMRAAAILKGEELIELERRLEVQFVKQELNKDQLEQILKEIAEVRSDLRFIHLSTHLKTPELLQPAQIRKYNILRGYQNDPCKSVPKNHDPVMWRKHNNCS